MKTQYHDRPRRPKAARHLASVGLLALAVSATGAQAQEAAGGKPVELGPVTVEGESEGEGRAAEQGDGPVQGYVATRSRAGTKTDTPLAKTPQSVSVIPREQIEDQAAKSVAEALRYSASTFTEYRGASNFSDEMYIRGFGYVPRFVDGLTYGWGSLGKIDPYLLERVEVVRGPSSILYGQTSPGGIVNMATKRPTGDSRREVKVSVGTDNFYEGGFDVEGPVTADGSLSYRLVGVGHLGDGVEDHVEDNGAAFMPTLAWQPGDATSVTVSAMYSDRPEAGYRNFREAAGTLWPVRGAYIPIDFFVSDPDVEQSSLEQGWVGYEVEHALTDSVLVRQNTRYARIESDHVTGIWGALLPNGRTITRNASGGGEVYNQIVIDTQAQISFATGPAGHTVLGGLDYKWSEREYDWGRGPMPTIDWRRPVYGIGAVVLTPTDDTDTTADQIGLYVQDQIEFGRFTLSAGLRHDWASTEIDDNLAGTSESFDDSALSGRVGLIYTFDNGIAPYVSYSTSFEPVTQAAPAGRPRFDPTTAEQYEVGIKVAPGNGDYQVIASFFDITQRNVIKTDPVTRTPVQTGEIQSQGFELEGRAKVNENITLVASYSRLDAEVTRTPVATELGRMPSRLPEQQGALWGTYDVLDGPLAGFTFGAGGRFVGESWGDGNNTFKVPASTVYDAMVGYKLGYLSPALEGAEAQINATNLTDERYTSSCASQWACWYGAPLKVVGSLTYRW